MKRLSKCLFLFLVGGLIYYGIEMLWRGHSHMLMALVGGICFLLCGGLNEHLSWDMPLGTQCLFGDRVRYGDELYKCLQNHTSQSTWNPKDSPSLWVRIDDPAIEYPDWVQPTGSTDAYRIGAKVSHNNKHWINELDYNTYEPGVYGWVEV